MFNKQIIQDSNPIIINEKFNKLEKIEKVLLTKGKKECDINKDNRVNDSCLKELKKNV